MRLRVELSARAERDFHQIIDYLAKRSLSGTAAWIDAFESAIVSLADYPESQPLAPENADHQETIRNVLFKTKRGRIYRAIFILRHGAVFVTHVRGPGQRRIDAGDFYFDRSK